MTLEPTTVPATPCDSPRPAVGRSQRQRAQENEDLLTVNDTLDIPPHSALHEDFPGITVPDQELIGDLLGSKAAGTFRVICLNINNLPLFYNDPKNTDLFAAIRRYEADIILISEPGINWSLMTGIDRWTER